MTTEEQRQRAELEACTKDPAYFVFNYVYLLNKPAGGGVGAWVPFKLWPFQVEVLDAFRDNGRVIVLKARQLGLSWLALAFAMWLMLFRPIAEILIFSKTEEEAIVMLEERLKGIYRLLPDWMKCRQVDTDQATKWILSNGSTARAFSKRGGDSYNASLVILDEFDVLDVKDQDRIMRAVDPTVGDGGKLFQISRVDKDKPESMFKVTFKGSWERRRRGEASQWAPIFLGWHVRPDRDRAWYESKALEILERTGSHDDLHEQYPATPEEALQPRTLNKRFPAGWLGAVYARLKPLDLSIHTSIPPVEGLRVYAMPEDGVGYVMGGTSPRV